jgi:hypothetical protein
MKARRICTGNSMLRLGAAVVAIALSADAHSQAGQQIWNSTRSSEFEATESDRFVVASPARLHGRIEGILDCDAMGRICVVRNMPHLVQSDPRVVSDVREMGGAGCYDTSIVTVALTALANRAKGLQPAGRTRFFEDIDGTPAMPKEVAQLSQQYRWVKQYQSERALAAKGQYSGRIVQPLYFDEVLADFGKIGQSCDPYTFGACGEPVSNGAGNAFRTFVRGDEITNEYVIGRMKAGYVMMIAYARYQPVDQQGPQTFVRKSQHKVVFAGFQPGKYPLLVNNVGDGRMMRARLTTDLSDRLVGPVAIEDLTEDALRRKGEIAKVRHMNPRPVYPLPTHVFLEFEGERAVNEQVYFIEHVDGLRIRTQ